MHISPLAVIFAVAPGKIVPTEPTLVVPGFSRWLYTQSSVIPYTTKMFISNFLNQSNISTEMGAAPHRMVVARARPSFFLIPFFTIEFNKGIDNKRFNFFCDIFLSTPCRNLVQICGTAIKQCGWVAARFSAKLAMDSEKLMVHPL